MRKITEQSVNAFLNRTEFKKGNMKVENLDDGWTYLLLHNNCIAILNAKGNLSITDTGWQTNTTKERLNGLPGVSIVQKNWKWFLNGKEWNGCLTQIS
jgi:hypothetical protein